MKILLVILIMLLFFIFGYMYKQEVKSQYDFMVYLKNYSNFLSSNISLFKNNLVKITDDFLNLNSQKNAKFNKIFVKNGEIYSISQKNIDFFLKNEQDRQVVFSFLSTVGNNDYEYENNKINSFIIYLNEREKVYLDNIKLKGELTLKILISIGLVVSILVW
mgnify:CR=1 FL=1